jgi:hypothetical protein
MDKIQSLQKSSQYNNSRKKTIEGFKSPGPIAIAMIVIASIVGLAMLLFAVAGNAVYAVS